MWHDISPLGKYLCGGHSACSTPTPLSTLTMSGTSLDLSLGPIELGTLVSTMLCGVMMVQCYTYYQARFNDKRFLRSLVSRQLIMVSYPFTKIHEGHICAVCFPSSFTKSLCSNQSLIISSLFEILQTSLLWAYLYNQTITNFGEYASEFFRACYLHSAREAHSCHP